MKKNSTITYISSWEEYQDAIWDAVVEYTHDLHGNEGHIQTAFDGECEVFLVQSTAQEKNE